MVVTRMLFLVCLISWWMLRCVTVLVKQLYTCIASSHHLSIFDNIWICYNSVIVQERWQEILSVGILAIDNILKKKEEQKRRNSFNLIMHLIKYLPFLCLMNIAVGNKRAKIIRFENQSQITDDHSKGIGGLPENS